MTKPQLRLENQICHSLYSATNALVRAYRPLLEALDLTYPQYLVMLSLWEKDAVIIKSLVEQTRLDAGTLTPLLKRLQEKGLITLQSASGDSRQKVVTLSKKGRHLRRSAEDIPEKLLCHIQMPREQAIQLKMLAEDVYRRLTDQAGE